MHENKLQQIKDIFIYNTHHLAKVIKKLEPLAHQKESHDVMNEKDMDGESCPSTHCHHHHCQIEMMIKWLVQKSRHYYCKVIKKQWNI